MFLTAIGEKSSGFFEVLNNLFVCIFDIDAFIGANLLRELSVLINGHRGFSRLDEFALLSDRLEVILTETWCAVYDSSTGVR